MKKLRVILLCVLLLLVGCGEEKKKTIEDIRSLLTENGWVTTTSFSSFNSSYNLNGDCVYKNGEQTTCSNVPSEKAYERTTVLYWNDISGRSIVAKTNEEGLVSEIVYNGVNGFYVFGKEKEVVVLNRYDNCRYYIDGEDVYAEIYDNCEGDSIKQAQHIVKDYEEVIKKVNLSSDEIVDYLKWVNDDYARDVVALPIYTDEILKKNKMEIEINLVDDPNTYNAEGKCISYSGKTTKCSAVTKKSKEMTIYLFSKDGHLMLSAFTKVNDGWRQDLTMYLGPGFDAYVFEGKYEKESIYLDGDECYYYLDENSELSGGTDCVIDGSKRSQKVLDTYKKGFGSVDLSPYDYMAYFDWIANTTVKAISDKE